MRKFNREEHVKYLYDTLHEIYLNEVGVDINKLTPKRKIKAVVKMLEKGLHDFNFMSSLIYAYDYLANPDMGENGQPVYINYSVFKPFGPNAVAELKFFAEVGTMAYGVDNMHSFKIPSFMTVWGNKFSLDNKELVEFIYEKGHELLSLHLVAIIADEKLDANIRVNGIYQDRIARDIHHVRVGASRLSPIKIQDMKINFMYNLVCMHRHEEIGKMLGLRGWQLGNYDAIKGYFTEAFDPDIVKMTKELNAWIAPLMKGENMDILPDTFEEALVMLREKMNSLAEKYGVHLGDEDQTFNYIFSNNCRLFELSLDIMD